jgi:hypothetical protein
VTGSILMSEQHVTQFGRQSLRSCQRWFRLFQTPNDQFEQSGHHVPLALVDPSWHPPLLGLATRPPNSSNAWGGQTNDRAQLHSVLSPTTCVGTQRHESLKRCRHLSLGVPNLSTRVGTQRPQSLKTCRHLPSRVSQNVYALSVSSL